MPVRSILRVNSGSWLALPMVLLAAIFAWNYQPTTSDPYAMALTAAGTITLAFVAPICAALGAWEGSRFRRAAWWQAPHVRSGAVIAAWSTGPVIIAGSVAVTLAVMLQLTRAGLFVPDARLLALTVLVIAAHTMLGFAAGLWVSVVIAAPAMLIVSFLWMAFLATIEPLWVRHLNGSLATCCGLQQDLAPAALAAASLVAVGMIASALLLIAQQRWSLVRGGIAVVVLAVGFAAGSAIASPLGPDPVIARDASALVCAKDPSGVEVCVWPEHAPRLDEVLGIAAGAVTAWDAAGIPNPRRFSEGAPADQAAPAFGFSLESTGADIVGALAYSLLPPRPSCADTGPYPSASALDDLHAWFAAVAGMSAPDLAQRFDVPAAPADRAPLDAVRALRERPRKVQQEWVSHNLEAARDCVGEPVNVPTA